MKTSRKKSIEGERERGRPDNKSRPHCPQLRKNMSIADLELVFCSFCYAFLSAFASHRQLILVLRTIFIQNLKSLGADGPRVYFSEEMIAKSYLMLRIFFGLSSMDRFWAPKRSIFWTKIVDNFLCWRTIFDQLKNFGWSKISGGKNLSASLKNYPLGACNIAQLL